MKAAARSQKDSYSSREVCALLGLTYRQLHYLMQSGQVPGLIPRGSGNPVRFTKMQVGHIRRLHAERVINRWGKNGRRAISDHPERVRDRAYLRSLRILRRRHILEFDSILEQELGNEYAKEISSGL